MNPMTIYSAILVFLPILKRAQISPMARNLLFMYAWVDKHPQTAVEWFQIARRKTAGGYPTFDPLTSPKMAFIIGLNVKP